MSNTKLTFNETTYEFNYFLGRNEKTNNTYDCYGVYINGELNTDYVLEQIFDSNGFASQYKVFGLFYKSFYTYIAMSNFELDNVVKVINYINSNK